MQFKLPMTSVIVLCIFALAAVAASLLAFFRARRAGTSSRTAIRGTVRGSFALCCVTGIMAGAGYAGISHLTHVPSLLYAAAWCLILSMPMGILSLVVNGIAMSSLAKSPDASRKEWMMVACGCALCLLPYAVVLPGCL